jgi:hypothetical protein
MTPGEKLRRARLFVISYGPLWLMLASRAMPERGDWQWSAQNTWVSGLLALGGVWSFVDAWRLVRGAQRKAAIRMRFAEIRDEGSAAAGYLATYLVPLLAEAPTRPGLWLAYGLYLGMAVVLFVRTDLALVNPTLYVFGWRVVSAARVSESQPARAVLVVCRDIAALRGDVQVVRLAGCYVTKNELTAETARN